jgi:hypothetical protein
VVHVELKASVNHFKTIKAHDRNRHRLLNVGSTSFGYTTENSGGARTVVPRKLVELAFRRIWILVLPVLVIPLAVVALNDSPDRYQSSAVVWITNPPAGTPAVGQFNPYLSPSANQSNALNDLLATEAFRAAIAKEAGFPPGASGEAPVAPAGDIWSYSRGVNLLVIEARSDTAAGAQGLVSATISQFNERAAAQAQRDAELGEEYYQQQIALAQEVLDSRRRAVDEYIRANPSALTPGSAASLSFDYQALKTRAEDQALLVTGLLRSLQDVQFRLAGAPQNQETVFSVQDEASLPGSPIAASATTRFGYPVAGAVLGLLISGAYLYVRYRTDHSVMSSEDVAGLDLRVLGRVPELRGGSPFTRLPVVSRINGNGHRDFARHTASGITSNGGQHV